MKKSMAVFGAVLLFALTAAAQETPKAETFLGFTYVRFNSATNVPSFSANGGGGQFVFNFNKWLGFVSDLGAVHNGNIGGYHLDSTFTNFMFGPRVPIRMSSRFTPYFQALWGEVYASTSALVQVPPGSVTVPPPVDPGFGVPVGGSARNAIDLRASTQQTAFAQAYGGGLDIASNAARFDVSLAWFSWAGAAVSLSLLVDWQLQGLLRHPVALARRLAGHLGLPEPVGSVISVPVDDAESVRSSLAGAGIQTAVRAGNVRLSPHVYNTATQIDRAAHAIESFVRQPARQ